MERIIHTNKRVKSEVEKERDITEQKLTSLRIKQKNDLE
jgi:hypothetical protein